MLEIEMPDGVILEFPANMPEQEARSASQKYWADSQRQTGLTSTETIQQAPEESFADKVGSFFKPGLSDKEKAQSTIAVTNAEDQNKRPHEFMGPDRNVLVDSALGATRGALVDAPETMLRAGRTLGFDADDEIKAVQAFGERNYQPSFQHLNTALRRDVVDGFSSSTASMATGLPGAIAGSLGGIPGAIAGYTAGGGTIYGLAEYDRFIEEAKSIGLNPEDVKQEAILAAVTEGGLESVSNLLDIAVMKVGKPLTSAATNKLKLFAANYLKTVAAEVPTEMTQSAAGVAIRNEAGFPEQSPWQAAKDSIRPTLVSGLAFAGAGTLARRKAIEIPHDEPTDLLDAEPAQSRSQALDLSEGEAKPMPLEGMRQYYKNEEHIHGTEPNTALQEDINSRLMPENRSSAIKSDLLEKYRFEPSPEIAEGIKRETALRENAPIEPFDRAESLTLQSAGPLAPVPFEGQSSLSPEAQKHLAPTPVEETFSLNGPDTYVEPGEPAVIETALSMAAHEAATSPTNGLPEPTQAQKEAGNYKKGKARILGMDIAIENPVGSERTGIDESGKDWSIQMQHHYGYIKGTEGKDKDQLDLFIKDGVEAAEAESKPFYVVDQINKDGSFDEHKIMSGFNSEEEARTGYLSNYEDGWNGLGAITEMSPEKFKSWIKNGNTKRAVNYRKAAFIKPEGINISKSGNPFTKKGINLVVTNRIRKGENVEPVQLDEAGKEWGWRDVVDEGPKLDVDAHKVIREKLLSAVPDHDYDKMVEHADTLIDDEGFSTDDVYEVVSQIEEEPIQARGRADYEERREGRIERLEGKAINARVKSDQFYKASDLREESSGIPFGQPILVGHHSEGKHRRAIERAHKKMDKSVEEGKKADLYERRAESAKESTAISSDDPQAVVKLKKKIAELEQAHEKMKAANKVVRSKKLDDKAKIEKLVEQGFKETFAEDLLNPPHYRSKGFPSYSITNNSAKIRNAKKRLKQMQVQDAVPTSEVKFDGGRIVDSVEENRLQIFFDEIPSKEVRTSLKRNGFKWARSTKAWQRLRSTQAMWLAKNIAGINEDRDSDTRSDIRLSFSGSTVSKPSVVAEVKSAISKLEHTAVNAGKTEVVQSVKDLPEQIQAEFKKQGTGVLEAAYADGRVYLVADNIPSSKRAVELWMHEQGVHHGLRGLFSDKELKQFFNKVHLSAATNSVYKNIVRLYGLDISKQKDRHIAAEEYLAHLGEKVKAGEILEGRAKTIWQKLVAMFRRFLNQLSFSKEARLTYAEIEQKVANVVAWTVRGTEGQFDSKHGLAVAFSQAPTGEQLEAGLKLQEDINHWGEQLDGYRARKLNPRDILTVGQTPEVLQKLGAPDLPMSMRQKIVRKITGGKRDISFSILKELPRHLATPIMIFDSATMANSLVVITEMKHEGKPLFVAVHMDVHEGRINVNDIASVYGKDGNPAAWARWQTEEGNLRYVDKKRSPAWLRSFSTSRGRDQSRLQLSGEMHSRSSRNKIITDKDIVKPVLPGDVVRFSRGEMTAKQVVEAVNEPEMRNFLNEKDVGWLQEVAALPHWIAKRFPEFQEVYDRQLSRMDERSAMFSDSLKEVESFFTEVSKSEMQEVSDMVWKLDGEKIEDIAVEKFIPLLDEDKKKVRENGRVVLEPNSRYYEQLEDWVEKQSISKKAAKVFLDVRKSLDNDFLRAYDAMRQMSEIGDNEIDEFRKQINHVQNYFPHHRYGKYFVAGYANDDKGKKVCVYREHFDASHKFMANKIAQGKIKELRNKYPDASTWDRGKNEKLPDEVYGVPIDTNALEQIVTSAASSIADPDQAGDVRAKLSLAVSDVLKSRGWGSHAIGRKNIPGHEQEDLRRVLYDYKAGLTGWLTKMEASRDMTKAVGRINARKHPKLYKYALTYVQNMLRNSDSIDRAAGNLKAVAFAWYLGGNIKTAVLNLTQNIITGVPRLGMVTKGGGIKTFNAAASSIVASVSGAKNLTKDEQQLLDDMYKEGVITEAFLDEIKGQISGVSGSKYWNKTLKWLGMPMALAERFNRATLALAAYRVARDGQLNRQETIDSLGIKPGENVSYEQAKSFAETIVRDAHFVYGKANQPQPFRNSSLGRGASPIYTFRTFSHNLLSLWKWMLGQGGEGYKAIGKSLGATAVLGGVTALPFYYSALAITQALTGDDDDWTEEIRKSLPESDLIRDVVCYGMPAVAGVSMGGSLSLEMPLARNIEPGSTPLSVVGENMGEILGIPYDLILKKPSRITKFHRAGDNYRAIEEAVPTVIKNMMKGYRMYTEGQTSVSGKPINDPGHAGPRKLSLVEALTKGMGFQPVSNTKNWDRYRARSISKKLRSDKLAGLSNRLVRAVRESDRERMVDVLDDLNSWNKSAMKDKKVWLLIMPADLKRGLVSRAKSRGIGKREILRLGEQMKAN